MSYKYDTSLPAYKEVLKNLGDKQRIVCESIRALCEKSSMCTDRQIADNLGWPINRVTNRRGELVDAGLVIDAGVFPNDDGRKVHFWK